MAEAGKLSLHFVNTTGAGILVAPFGGINRRLSANPIAAGIPVPDGPPLILDMSACTLAEGKIRVALNKGVPVPENCIIDAHGKPTTDPRVFYADPPGAILSIAGHKGYGLRRPLRSPGRGPHRRRLQQPSEREPRRERHASIILDVPRFQGEDAYSSRDPAVRGLGEELGEGHSETVRS